jgi:hypothetical protein
MVPVYTFLSSICTLSYPASLYMEPLQEFYEAIALASIFSLFCNYMRPTLGAQFQHLAGAGSDQAQGMERKGADGKPQKTMKWFKVCGGTNSDCFAM